MAVFSFDVFDTVLFRRLEEPSDIFAAVEEFKPELQGFFEARVSAEDYFRSVHLPALGREDGTLLEMWSAWPELSSWKSSLKLGNHGEIAQLVEAEELAERHFTYLNPKLLDNGCWSKSDELIAVSNSMLTEEFLETLLAENGFPVQRVFSSGSRGLLKQTGSLYHLVLREIGLSSQPDKLVHHGDSPKNDGAASQALGIAFCRDFIEKSPSRLQRGQEARPLSLDFSTYSAGFAQEGLISTSNFEDVEGRTASIRWAMILLGYLGNIERTRQEAGKRNIVFMARGAELCHRIYLETAQGVTGTILLDISRFVFSRALLTRVGVTSLSKFISQLPRPIEEYSEGFVWSFLFGELPDENSEVGKLSATLRQNSSKRNSTSQISDLIKVFGSKIEQANLNQMRLLGAYLEQSINPAEDILCDIGWEGGLVSEISSILGNSLHSELMFVDEGSYKYLETNNRVEGWLVNPYSSRALLNLAKVSKGYVESVLATGSGALIGYRESQNGEIEPLRLPPSVAASPLIGQIISATRKLQESKFPTATRSEAIHLLTDLLLFPSDAEIRAQKSIEHSYHSLDFGKVSVFDYVLCNSDSEIKRLSLGSYHLVGSLRQTALTSELAKSRIGPEFLGGLGLGAGMSDRVLGLISR